MSTGKALLDTNILTAFQDVDYARHENVVAFLCDFPDDLFVAPQSFFEYWAVATRPKGVNGLARSPEVAWFDILGFREIFESLPDPANLLDEWLDLCRAHAVSGKPAHDARLAAYARVCGLKTIVTLNARDFARYGLNVVVP